MSKWSPQNDKPALTLAAIRWYGISIEKLAMDLYLTHPSRYPAVQAILGDAMEKLGKMRNEFQGQKPMWNAAEEDGCGPGYVNCNGVCLPECDQISEY